MIINRRRILSITSLIFIGLLAAYWLHNAGPFYLPALQLKTMDGNKIDLASLEGKPALLFFWASNCGTCIKETPHLVSLYNELAPKGLKVIGVVIYWDTVVDAQAFVQVRKLPYPIALDTDKKATYAFGGIHLTPTSVLIAPSGRIVFIKQGELDYSALRKKILAMLPVSG